MDLIEHAGDITPVKNYRVTFSRTNPVTNSQTSITVTVSALCETQARTIADTWVNMNHQELTLT